MIQHTNWAATTAKPSPSSMIIVITGVSGSGKSSIGKRLAEAMSCEFYEGDAYHSPANKEKMQAGIPLTDEDRWPWLAAIRDSISEALVEERNAVVSCSALTQTYRDYLRQPLGGNTPAPMGKFQLGGTGHRHRL